jgi:hypothetical protein
VPITGETVTLRFDLPDGTSTNLTLTATTDSPPRAGEFTIGATAAATAGNFQAALTTATAKLAGGTLTAASAVAASDDFFSADSNTPPPRVDGPPFATATAMTSGSAADTVIWYVGESDSGSARMTSTARIDPSQAVAYGARASEEGLRTMVQNIATLAAVTVSATDPNAVDLSSALNQRLNGSMSTTAGVQTIADIQADLAGALSSLSATKTRHQQTTATLGDFLQQIEGVSNEQVAAQILALQTQMQASMQTTAMLFQTSLVNYMS